MSKNQILDQVKDLMSQQFEIEPKEITLDTNFQEDLDADSIDLMKIARKSSHFNGEMDRAYLISVINPFTCLTHATFLIETTLSFGCADNLTYKP